MTEPVSNADSKAIGQETALSATDVALATLLVVLDTPLIADVEEDMMMRMIIVALLVTIDEEGIILLVLDVPTPGRTLLVVLIAPVLLEEEHHHPAPCVLQGDHDHQEDRRYLQEECLHLLDRCHQEQGDHQKEEFQEDLPLPESFLIHQEELDRPPEDQLGQSHQSMTIQEEIDHHQGIDRLQVDLHQGIDLL